MKLVGFPLLSSAHVRKNIAASFRMKRDTVILTCTLHISKLVVDSIACMCVHACLNLSILHTKSVCPYLRLLISCLLSEQV